MRVSTIIFLSFIVILLLFTATTFINYRQSEHVLASSGNLSKSTQIVRHANRFQRNFLGMVGGLHAFVMTRDKFFLENYDSTIVENKRILAELRDLVSNHQDQLMLLNEIQDLQQIWLDAVAFPVLSRFKTTGDSSGRYMAMAMDTLSQNSIERKVQKRLQVKFASFTNFEYGTRESEQLAMTEGTQSTRRISFFLTVVSIVIGTGIALMIAGHTSSRINGMVKMANAISGGNYSLRLKEDSSELGQLARELNTMASTLDTSFAQLERQKNELDQFAHIISHDLRAPLQGIENILTWIKEDHHEVEAKLAEYLKLISQKTKRTQSLLNGILQYARAGAAGARKEIIPVSELVYEVASYIVPKHHVTLQVQALPQLFGERVPLEQVFTNLIVNAFKHHNKPEGFVKVYSQEKPEHYVFFVEDNGPGIDSRYHEKIFSIFETLGDRPGGDSVGVGLAIVKKILDDRGLDINVFSSSTGSIFSFTWPKM